jgi:type I restriction enzyme S subunit
LAKIKRFEIPLPPLSEQKRIAEILDRAEALRAKRRAALALLDELTQSIFLDMFGDPVVNPKGFPIAILSEFYADVREGTKCGPFGSALKKHEYVDEGVPVWNMDNIDADGRMSLPFRMWITESKFRKLAAYAVEDGDIIISRAGTVGKMCVTNLGNQPSLISTNLIRLRLGPKLLPIYFVSLMTYCKGRIARLKTGPDGAFTHMNTKILDNLKFPYPSIVLQRRFADALNSTDKHKSLLQSQLLELDGLFAALQHGAFWGQL